MTKQRLNLLAAPALLAVLAIIPVPAQAADVSANVPFEFVVNGRTLSPGTYTISTIQGALAVRGLNQGAFATSIALLSRQENTPKLVFHRYGAQYFLRQAWTGGGSGREIPETSMERELVKTARNARASASVERVVIPAS